MSWTNIGRVLSSVKNRPGMKNKFQTEIFKKILQKQISLPDEEIKKLSFKNKKFTIEVKSFLLTQEIFLSKENIKKEINKYFKKEEVKEIIVKKA